MKKPGDRVGAILSTKGDTVNFLGFGVYDGDFPVGEEVAGFMAEVVREAGIINPRIALDCGEVVWGCECWWGPEARIKAELAKYKTINTISPSAFRCLP